MGKASRRPGLAPFRQNPTTYPIGLYVLQTEFHAALMDLPAFLPDFHVSPMKLNASLMDSHAVPTVLRFVLMSFHTLQM